MVNWSDPSEIANDTNVFVKMTMALFGVYLWEIFITSGFEWSLITRRRKFQWPLIFFFLCRYCMIWSLIGLIIASSVTTEINCQALYHFNAWAGNMAIICASTSLMIRTLSLWKWRITVLIPLLALCLGHWGLLYYGILLVHAVWEPSLDTCIISSAHPSILSINFFYTVSFDFVMLVFAFVALIKYSERIGLWQLLVQDGLFYFIVPFVISIIPAVLSILNLNTVMNVIAMIPAATATSIAACRLVMQLQEFSTVDVPDLYAHSATNVAPTNRSVPIYSASKSNRSRPDMHLNADHITLSELSPSVSTASEKERDRSSFRTYNELDLDLGSSKAMDAIYETSEDGRNVS